MRFIHLIKDGGQQFSQAYQALNADALLPASIDDTPEGPRTITQSLAIMEYLEDTYGGHALLPASPLDRAYVRSIALSVARDIHPLNNLRVLRYLAHDLHVGQTEKDG